MSEPIEPLQLPSRAVFWRWVADSLRPVVGWVLVGLGALALLLGWYGVSGESLTAKQLPYLVSGGLTGIGLIVIAAVFLATEDVRQQMSRLTDLERKVDDLYALFVDELGTPMEPQPGTTAPPAATPALPRGVPAATRRPRTGAEPAELVALPSGSSYHRSTCPLAVGKPDARAVDADTIRDRRLRPCRVCAPDELPAGKPVPAVAGR